MKSRISYIVELSGLTKTAFAKRINVSQGLVSQMCSGITSPSERTLSDICREFGVDPVWLRTGEGEPFLPVSREDRITEILSKAIDGPSTARDRLIRALARLPDDAFPLIEQYTLSAAESIQAEKD